MINAELAFLYGLLCICHYYLEVDFDGLHVWETKWIKLSFSLRQNVRFARPVWENLTCRC